MESNNGAIIINDDALSHLHRKILSKAGARVADKGSKIAAAIDADIIVRISSLKILSKVIFNKVISNFLISNLYF